MTTRSYAVRLRAEVNQFKADMAAAGKSASDAAKKTETAWDQSSSHMGKMMQNAKRNEQAWNTTGGVLTAVGGGIIGLGVAATKSGVEFNSLNQTATAALTSVMQSAEGATRQMDKMNEFGRGTWVMRDSIIRAQQTMTGFGISTQKVIPYMDSLAETVAATTGSNQDFEELARVMGKVESEGKITATTFREFGTRGVDAAALIGEAMGMTAQEIRESVTDGTLDAGEALDALAEGMKTRFDGASENMRQTFSGAFANVYAGFRDLSASLAEPLVSKEGGGLLVDGFNTLADSLNQIRDISEDIPEPVKLAGFAFGGLTAAASLTAGGFLLLAPRLVETQKAFQVLAGQDDLVGKLAGGMQKVAPSVLQAAAAAAVAVVSWKALDTALDKVTKSGIPDIEKLSAEMQGLAAHGREASGALDAAFSGGLDSNLANTLLGTSNAVGDLDDAFAKLAQHDNPLGPVLLAAQRLQPGTQDLEEATDGVKAYDGALVDLVNGGAADEAAAAFDRIAGSLLDQGHDIDFVVDQFGGYKGLLEETANALDVTSLSAEDYAGWMRGEVPEAVQEAADANYELAEGLAGIEPAAEGAASGLTTMSEEAVEAQEQLSEMYDSLYESSLGFADFAEKATDADVSMRDWIKSMEEQVVAQEEWHTNLQTLIDRGAPQALIDHFIELGAEGAFRVKELADGSEEDLGRAGDAFDTLSEQASGFAGTVTQLPDINLEADDTTLRSQLWFAKEELGKLHRMEPSPKVNAQITALEEKIRMAEEQLGDLDNDSATPKVGVSGADQSKGKIEGVHDALLNADGESAELKVEANVSEAEGSISGFFSRIGQKWTSFWDGRRDALQNDPSAPGQASQPKRRSGSSSAFSRGGSVRGPGSGTSDDIPALLSNGEHVWTAEEVRRAGGHSAIYAMRQALMSGDIPGFAAGGAVASARGDLARAERDLERIQKQGKSTTASDRKREAAQKRVEREREALRKAEEAQARRERVRDLQTDFRTDTRRGSVRDQVTGSLSGGYSAVDRLAGLGDNEDLSASARNMANSRARKFEADLRRLYGQAERVDEKLQDAQDTAKELEGIQSSVASTVGRNAYDLDVTSQWSQGAQGVWSQTSGVSGVRTNSAAAAARAKELATKLGRLQKMGYAGAILQEVAQAGSIEASIEMADALLEGSGSDVSSINDSYASIEKYAQQAGKYVTGGFYDGGVDAAQGVVKGLESQQKSIESQIERLAKGMETVFKQVLGIRSPSRVMAELGVFTAEGLVEGMLSGQSAVADAASALAGSAVPNMRYDIDMTANPVVDSDAVMGQSAMQDMSAITLMAMQEMRAAVGEGWTSMLTDTQAAQLGMLTDTTAKQFSMRDVTAVQQEQMRAIVLGQQTAMRDATTQNQESTRVTVADRQARTRQNVSSEQELMRSIMAEKQTSMRDRNRSEFESMRSTSGEKLRAMRSSGDSIMTGFRDDYASHMSVLKEHNRSAHSTMESASKAAFRGIRSGMNEQMREARPELGSRMNSLIGVLAKFTKSVNTAFGDVGVDLDAPQRLSFATGGVMPGYTPGRDVHSFYSPTAGSLYLSGGEAIMRPEFTRAIGGEQGVQELNQLARGGRFGDMNSMLHTAMYANGGVFASGPVAGVNAFADSGVWRSLFGAVKERFPNVGLHSAYRPGAITATGNRSQHGLGNAIDISPRMDIAEWIRENFGGGTRELIYSPMGGRQINRGRNHMYTGITRSMHFDHIHWAMEQMLQGVMPFTGDGTYSGGMPTHPFLDKAGVTAGADLSESYREAAQKLMSGIMDKHVGQLSGMPPMMQDLGKGIMGKARTGLVKKAEEHGESMKFVMPGGEGVARWRDTVIQALRYAGLPQTDDYIGAWLRQIQSESGGNPNIRQGVKDVNSGGNEAMGLVQVIPGTFASYRDKSLPNDRTHPLANLVAGMNWAKYKAGRQGRDMLSFIGHGHGYKDGTANAKSGWAVVGEEGPELLKLNGGERIESNPDTRKMLAANRTFIPNQAQTIDFDRLGQAIAKALPNQDIAAALNGAQMTLNVDGKAMTGFVQTAVASGYSESKSRLARSSNKAGAR